MAYRVENIGKEFSGKALQGLLERLNAAEVEGWELVLTFPVTVSSGCLGLTKQQSIFAVFHKK
jgi:hypothetical protein